MDVDFVCKAERAHVRELVSQLELAPGSHQVTRRSPEIPKRTEVCKSVQMSSKKTRLRHKSIGFHLDFSFVFTGNGRNLFAFGKCHVEANVKIRFNIL